MTLYNKLKLSFFYHLKYQDIGLSTKECDALEKLANNLTLIIYKPDKSNREVVMNKDDHINKMNKMLSKKTQFIDLKILGEDGNCKPCT